MAADRTPTDDGDALDAGAFGEWAEQMSGALAGRNDATVPCGTCTACCTSSQFVHVAPDEEDARAHIPDALLFPAPGLPVGHLLMGYDEHGRCPMLVDGACSIYDHRPRTCRTYDCRVFPATGVVPDDASNIAIARRTQQWRFRVASDADRVRRDAMRAAAAFVRAHAGELHADAPPARPAPTATQLAVLAVELHDLFLARGPDGVPTGVAEPTVAEVAVRLQRRPRPA